MHIIFAPFWRRVCSYRFLSVKFAVHKCWQECELQYYITNALLTTTGIKPLFLTKDTKFVPDPNFIQSRVRRSTTEEVVLMGPRAQPAPVGVYPRTPGSVTTPVCCGSDSGLSGLPSKPTGQFERHNNVGSFQVILT